MASSSVSQKRSCPQASSRVRAADFAHHRAGIAVSDRAKDALPDVGPEVTRIVTGKDQSHVQYLEFPEEPLDITTDPGPYCLPQELFEYTPGDEQLFKFFFKGTSREVRIRQIFFHTLLTDQEHEWLRLIRQYCRWRNFPIRPCLEPLLLRICYYAWRKFGEKEYLKKAYEHILETVNWRAAMFPISDRDPELLEDLCRGVMYWAARDQYFRPLLIVRLKRLSRCVSPQRFKRLTVFCFEWAIRYLFVPGLVETCIVVFDVRGIALHQFPLSALTDMTTTLTRQYPFRLDCMYIVNDSFFIQTVWSVARQFLTEVQQQKMNFLRTGFSAQLLKSFARHHLEREYGGTRDEFKTFYPFPLVAGPFTPTATSVRHLLCAGEQYVKLYTDFHQVQNAQARPNCWKAVSRETARGVMWEGDVRTPIQWSPEAPRIFADCGLQFPYPTDAETSTASVSVSNAEAPATLADVETAEQEQVVLAKPNHHSSPSSSLSQFGKCVENASLEPFFEKQPSIKVPETNDSSSTRKGREVPGSASLASPTIPDQLLTALKLNVSPAPSRIFSQQSDSSKVITASNVFSENDKLSTKQSNRSISILKQPQLQDQPFVKPRRWRWYKCGRCWRNDGALQNSTQHR